MLEVRLLHPAAAAPFAQPPGRRRLRPADVERVALARASADGPDRRGDRAARRLAGLVLPRSGLAAKHGIAVVNGPGLIDPNYRGEIKVILVNLGTERFEAEAGDRIAQLLVVPFVTPEVAVTDDLPPSGDDRGTGGFGFVRSLGGRDAVGGGAQRSDVELAHPEHRFHRALGALRVGVGRRAPRCRRG